jgi:hypothetical protein
MTDPNDKLVAISGLAKYFASKSMGALGQYAAGLWETQLESQLTWTPNPLSRPPKLYRAPSWSWASVDGDAWEPSSKYRNKGLLSNVLEVKTTLNEPFGRVSDGFIRILGPLCKVDTSESHTVIWATY